MARHDLIIRGGTVATAGDIIRCDIAVKDGRVALLGHDLRPRRSGASWSMSAITSIAATSRAASST